MTKKNTFYVTTPIYYVTARPHLGSLYSTVLADILAKWHKMQGEEVFLLTGTDEHGQKVAQAAQKAGKEPQAFVDSFIEAFKDTWKRYHIDCSHFIRTTDKQHKYAVQEWLLRLKKKGDIYKDFYVGWYCTPCETFVAEKSENVDPLPCSSCGRETVIVEEETYFFRLSAYQDKLLCFYEQNPDFITPKERINEVIRFVESGLKDLSISRTTIKWGIPFSDDPEHTAYVWADALNNYITAIGWPTDMKKVDHWWPANVQVLGKDIIRFHAVFWPAFLMAIDLPMPRKLLVHGWINVDKQKMSKSLGNIVDPLELQKEYGADEVRYYLAKKLAITHDSEFSRQDLEKHIEVDLANDLGNLLNRLVMLAQKNDVINISSPSSWGTQEVELQDEAVKVIKEVKMYLNDCFFHMALARIWKYIHDVNGYFHNNEPWKKARTDRPRFLEIIAATRNSLHTIGVLLWPVMPEKMKQLLASIGVSLSTDHPVLSDLELTAWQMQDWSLVKVPTLFKKSEEKKMQKQDLVQKEQTSEHILIDDLVKIHLVVGTIIECEQVPKSEKLLKMTVDCGQYGIRQILAGIRMFYEPEELVSRQGTFVLNLKPRKMVGIESQGMMLVAKDATGKTQLMSPRELVPNGTRLQ